MFPADDDLGIVYANLANINPTAAYEFFTQPDFDMSWIDGGASLTWYIALSAMLGGAPS
jgi:endo-1,3(4)-beta-glucanase